MADNTLIIELKESPQSAGPQTSTGITSGAAAVAAAQQMAQAQAGQSSVSGSAAIPKAKQTNASGANPAKPNEVFDPVAAAKEAMEAEQRKREVQQARLKLDPDFAAAERKKALDAKQQERLASLQKNWGTAQQMAGAFGGGQAGQAVGAVGNLVAGASGGGIGMIVQAVQAVKQLAEEEMRNRVATAGKMATAGLSRNPGVLMDQIKASVEQVPVFGKALGEAVTQVQGFSRALSGAVDRYSQFSPQVAMAKATNEIRDTLAEMNRAAKYGDQIAEATTAINRLENKVIDILMRIAIPLLERFAAGADGVGHVLDHLEAIYDFFANGKLPKAGEKKDAVADIDKILDDIASADDPFTVLPMGVGPFGVPIPHVRPVGLPPVGGGRF